MINPQPDRDSIELLATQFIEDCRGRDEPPIEEYCDRYPHLADQIVDLFPMIAALETMKKAEDQVTARNATTRPLRLTQLGDFKVVKEIGRGGMGIVYQAYQETLDRHVALKVLPKASLLAPESLQRFRQEARMAARLHHSNIVSLYGVGEHDGYHFLVMELVDGVSLDKVIQHLAIDDPSKSVESDHEYQLIAKIAGPLRDNKGGKRWKKIAAMGRDAADALQFAFEHNVLHRDIKPANVLLDVDGRVWISDFGLAQPSAKEPLLDDAHAKTSTAIGGTPRYLPPESIHGELDQRGDVYGLGLTLYELLTRQAAFTENTPREAAARLANTDSNDDAVPTKPREINPKIPSDLEAIVLKSIAQSPEDRYRSAEMMARDLDRFVSGRPVEARPIAWFKRLERWCKRNPTVASLSALAASLLLLVAIISTAGFVNASRSKAKVQKALQGETRSKQRLETSLTAASLALNKIYAQFTLSSVNDGALAIVDEPINVGLEQGGPILSSDTVSVLESLLDFYQSLAYQSDDSDAFDRASARTLEKMGDVHRQLGHPGRSLKFIQQAIDAWKSIEPLEPNDATPSVNIGRLYNEAGRVATSRTDYNSAIRSYRKALKILEAIPDPKTEAIYEQARALYFLGRARDVRPSAVAVAQIVRVRTEANDAQTNEQLDEVSDIEVPPDQKFKKPPKPFVAKDVNALQKAVKLLQRSSTDRKLPEFQFLLACCYRDLASSDLDNDEMKDLLENSDFLDIHVDEMARTLLTDLAERYPENTNYRYELVESIRRGHTPEQASFEDQSRILEGLDVAVDCINTLVWRHPNNPRFLESRMHVLHRRGHRCTNLALDPKLNDDEKFALLRLAIDSHRRASVDARHLVVGWPESESWQLWSLVIEVSAADVLLTLNRRDSALNRLDRSIISLEGICRDKTTAARFSDELPIIGRLLKTFSQKMDQQELVQRIDTALGQVQ